MGAGKRPSIHIFGLVIAITACMGPAADDDVQLSVSALTVSEVMGFESAGAWSTATAGVVLSQSTTRSQGSYSLGIRPSNSNGYTPLKSVPLSTLSAVSNRISWDVMLPTSANPNWFGTAQMYIDCPSRGIFNAWLADQIELTGKPINVWNTLTFSLTPGQVNSLATPGYTDLTFTLVLNVPIPTAQTYRVDNVRFVGAPVVNCTGKPNGSACNDGNACTSTDTCQAGVCVGRAGTVCGPSDSCHYSGVCNTTTGMCSNPMKPNGSSCDDANACTQTDTCQSGSCVGTNPRTCAALDQCHTAGTCDPATGFCSNPNKANGTTCNDNNPCTSTDLCQSGACTGTNVANGTACNDGNGCTQNDKCSAGSCLGLSAPNGTSCSDANACTRSDSCVAGACVGANPVTCTASDSNHIAGTCAPSSGTCSNPAKQVIPWRDSPISVTATRTHATGASPAAEKTVSPATNFSIPEFLSVNTGNAGTGQAELKIRVVPQGAVRTCSYLGGARESHPSNDLERARGTRYHIVACDGGLQVGQTVSIDWISLRIISGDALDSTGVTSVSINEGGGCSGTLAAHLSAEEVVVMRDNFSWQKIAKLPETDVEGHPAMFHGLIYLDRKEQMAALDRLRVFWQASPLSRRYMDSFTGKCGMLGHSTDGRGVVVYAVFPARLFNVVRDFGIQAATGNVPPPFRFIIPTPPDQPEFVNSDGSFKYSALSSSGFKRWLTAHPGQHAGWFSDAVDYVSGAAKDAWNWTKNKLIPATLNAGEYGFSYVGHSFDEAVDWTANFLDEAYEQAQISLADIVGRDVYVHLNFSMLNKDPQFAPGSLLTRMWGPADSSGHRPKLVPEGAQVHISQWLGPLPLLSEGTIGADGGVNMGAVSNAGPGFFGTLCIKMSTNYAVVTSDFVPNEVCDFAGEKYLFFLDNTWADITIDEQHLYGFTQIKDSADYFKAATGIEPYQFTVLTGTVANGIGFLSNHRGITPCLDFPATGTGALNTLIGGLAARANPYAAAFSLLGTSLLMKDLWWPDNDASKSGWESRGGMTHEYGHFAMCSILNSRGGAPALTGLTDRLWEQLSPGTLGRGSESALMTEAWADTFSLQVTGSAGYVRPDTSSDGRLFHFCYASPCMDANYAGNDDYVGPAPLNGPHYDEMARFESLIFDAFDRSDDTQRFSNAPGNSDVWAQRSGDMLLVPAPNSYIHNFDENISLPWGTWNVWVDRWLQRGRVPSVSNVVGGLVHASSDLAPGMTWCDQCEWLALHDKVTPISARQRDATLYTSSPTYSERFNRWTSCLASSQIPGWMSIPVPAMGLNLSASCVPCPLHNFVDSQGTCTPCPPDAIASRLSDNLPWDRCEQCPPNHFPSSTGEACTSP